MSTRSPKSYTIDFKRDALIYINEHPNMSIKDVAATLGVPKETIYGWTKSDMRKKILGEDTPASGPMSDAEKRLAEVMRENRDLKDALEVLKKAISILND